MGPPCLCKVVLIFLAMEPTKLIPLYAATALTTFLLHTWKSSSSCSRFLRNSFSAQDQRIAQRVSKERFLFMWVDGVDLPATYPFSPIPLFQPTQPPTNKVQPRPWVLHAFPKKWWIQELKTEIQNYIFLIWFGECPLPFQCFCKPGFEVQFIWLCADVLGWRVGWKGKRTTKE